MGLTDYDKKVCFICGSEGADTVDHVPPKNIFLKRDKNIGKDLITVPAHKNCNKLFEKDDEYFRYCLSIPAYWESKQARELWETKMKNQLHRSQSEGFRKYLLNNFLKSEIQTPSGIFLGKADLAMLDVKRMDRVLGRITRGIYYKINQNILPINTSVEVHMLHPNEGRKQIKNFKIQNELVSIGNETFKYYWKPTIENDNIGLMWLIFFNSVYFWIFTGL